MAQKTMAHAASTARPPRKSRLRRLGGETASAISPASPSAGPSSSAVSLVASAKPRRAPVTRADRHVGRFRKCVPCHSESRISAVAPMSVVATALWASKLGSNAARATAKSAPDVPAISRAHR